MLSLRGALLLLLFLATGACIPESLPLQVEYAGCKAVLVPGPVCILDSNRQLKLWVGAPDAKIEIQADGRPIDAGGELVQDGQRFSLTLPPQVKRLDVLVAAGRSQASWSLSLAERERKDDLLREVARKTVLIHRHINNRRLATARETLQTIRLPSGAPAESHYEVSYYRGLLAEREGDYRSALAEVQEAVKTAERVKLDRYRWLAEQKLALLLLGVGRSGDAVQLFERLRSDPHPWDNCEMAEFLGNQAWTMLLARETGERFGDPTHLLDKALATYESCSKMRPENRVNIFINMALAHLQEGRLQRAKELLARARRLEPDPPVRLTLWWLYLEARIALQEGRPTEALRMSDQLGKLASAAGSPDGRLRALFGEAQAQNALGDRAAALETLRRAEALLDGQSLQVPLHEGRETFMATRQAVVSLHVELLLDQDLRIAALSVARHARTRMLRQLERSDSLARLTPERRERWERLLTAYQEKRSALEERARNDWKLPPDRLRREQAARQEEAEAVKQLLDEAFLALEAPGRRTGEEPPPAPGELILTYHPLPRGWVGFAADGKTVAVHRFELPPDLPGPEELSRRLLLPFHAAIARAERIRILPSGPLEKVDFHALPFDGDVLLASRPVVYGLDLPVSKAPTPAAKRRALVVADPRDDLPGTLDEAGKVRRVLRSGWAVEELQGAEATAEAVRGRLAHADLFHYAGHSSYSGFGGWESSLLLAEDTKLELGDLLALARVPAWAVLSGCESGRSSAEVPVESLGLAQAFLIAGSRAAVASVRPADDRAVSGFFPELYRQWDLEPDLAVAFQRAQLAWRRKDPAADWQGFRLFVP